MKRNPESRTNWRRLADMADTRGIHVHVRISEEHMSLSHNWAIFSIALLVATFVFVPPNTAFASPNWSPWQKANSIAHTDFWLVIRQPNEGFCYINQAYSGSDREMDLSMKSDEIPYLTTPFFRGIQGDMTYQVDNGSLHLIKDEDSSAQNIKLSTDIVSSMDNGEVLTVRIKPVGRNTIEQHFDLTGFSEARDFLGGPQCRKKVADQAQSYN